MRLAIGLVWFAAALAAQQQPSLRQLAEMTVSIGDVRIGADEQGRSELCVKLAEMRREGYPVISAATGPALSVACRGRPARVLVLRLSPSVQDPKRAVCEYSAAPAGLIYDAIDWMPLRRGGPPVSGEEMRNRLEPLRVHTYAALVFAFGFERIEARYGAKTLVRAPLHQIDGFCAES